MRNLCKQCARMCYCRVMSNLRSRLSDLASSFADSVVAAIRSSSLEELIGESGPRPKAPRTETALKTTPKPAARAARTPSGRLPRRSSEDIAAELAKIVALVKNHKDGLRAEQIRTELGLQAKELPRVLKEGLSTKMLRSKGQKRATTYFAK